MDLELDGKAAIITGASGGLGRGLVLGFAEEGCRVVLADPDTEQGERVAEIVRQNGGDAIVVGTDITQPEAVDHLLELTVDRFGGVDVLVNNAGGASPPVDFLQKDAKDIRSEIDLNIWGCVNCTRAVGAYMLERGSGAIVNIASNAAVLGEAAPFVENYAGAKGYVVALSRSLAFSWGAKGVRINCIAPGWIVPHAEEHVGAASFWTRFGYDAFGSLAELEEQARQGSLPSVDSQPIPKLGRPEDIANLAMFLSSEKCAGHLTGQLVSVSGGAYMP